MLVEGTPQHCEETGRATQRRISSPTYALETLNGTIKSMLINFQRQIHANPGKRRLSSRSPPSKIAASNQAHSQEAHFQAVRWHDEIPARPLFQSTRMASSPRTIPRPMHSQTPIPASPAIQHAQQRPAARPLRQAKWSARLLPYA
jgi:hypothetical protein